MELGAAGFTGHKSIDTKLNVKPVFVFLAHHNSEEGPCRTGTPEQLAPEGERSRAEAAFGPTMARYSQLAPSANWLEPVFIEHGDDWLVRAEEYQKLDTDNHQVDVYVLDGFSLNQFFAVKLGERYGKPVVMVGGEQTGTLPMGCDAASHLRAKGLEAYVPLDSGEFNELLALLQARKAMRQTRILRVSQGQFDNVNGNFLDIGAYRDHLGFDAVDIPIDTFASEWDKVRQSPDSWRLAQDVAVALEQGAQASHIDREYVANDVVFYLAAKRLMEDYGCNAFLVNCFEICPDGRVAAVRKTVPCLTHTLFKDQGLPSACESDLGVLAAMQLLQSVASRTAYMGNIFLMNRHENRMKILHDVPGLKLKGYTAPDVPYELRAFTLGGWGTTVRYDFAQDRGQEVTIARFSPSADKVLVTHGTVVGGAGFSTPSCSLEVHIDVADVVSYFHKSVDFGNHSAMVFGDYRAQLRMLSELLNVQVTEA